MMTDNPDNKQFFNPHIFYTGKSEHASRFYNIAKLQCEAGKPAYAALSSSETEENKLKALDCLRIAAEEIGALKDDKLQDAFLSEFFIMARIKTAYLTEDTKKVSQQMSFLVVDLFRMAKKLTDAGHQRFNETTQIFSQLVEVAERDYERYHPDSQRAPNIRAEKLIKQLAAIDPALLDIAVCPEWQIYRELPERLDLQLTRYNQPFSFTRA